MNKSIHNTVTAAPIQKISQLTRFCSGLCERLIFVRDHLSKIYTVSARVMSLSIKRSNSLECLTCHRTSALCVHCFDVLRYPLRPSPRFHHRPLHASIVWYFQPEVNKCTYRLETVFKTHSKGLCTFNVGVLQLTQFDTLPHFDSANFKWLVICYQ